MYKNESEKERGQRGKGKETAVGTRSRVSFRRKREQVNGEGRSVLMVLQLRACAQSEHKGGHITELGVRNSLWKKRERSY